MIRQGWPYFEGWPFQERWLQIDGLGIHYVDEGYGSRPIVMVHGNPAWSYMWRNLIPAVCGAQSSEHRWTSHSQHISHNGLSHSTCCCFENYSCHNQRFRYAS